jgi:bacteriocin-like protein
MTNPKQEPNLTEELSDEQLTSVTGGTANPDVVLLPTPTPMPVPMPYPNQDTGVVKKLS